MRAGRCCTAGCENLLTLLRNMGLMCCTVFQSSASYPFSPHTLCCGGGLLTCPFYRKSGHTVGFLVCALWLGTGFLSQIILLFHNIEV